ncbi:MAG: S41 family peptidase [Planctomycetia bacterium]|nr:S41 family peptidase [Planctomycetia bacterium]
MRRRALFAAAFWFAAVVLSFGPAAPGQTSAPVSSRPAEVGELLRQGRQLEVEDRWGEALSYYEKAIREFPDEQSLQRRFDFTRSHYDLRRRYADASFRDDLDRSTLEDALDLYGEVLVKIQSYYVESPHWKELVERGINGLDVALSEPAFLDRNVPADKRPGVDAFRHEARRELGPRVIQDYHDAQAAVGSVADLARQRLGMSPVAVVLEFTCGATNSRDPYSAYLTSDLLAEVYSQIEGNFVGLGVELETDDGRLTITRVITGSPAEQAGIRSGDRILSIDGQLVSSMATDRAANLLQGKEGTVVQLSLAAAGDAARQASVRRRRVDVPSVDNVQILDAARGIGYLRLTCFQKTTSRDLDDALWKLHRGGMRGGLIMDLRRNPGGLLITAVEVVDKFVQQGTIVSTRGRNVEEGLTYSAHAAGTWGVPLVVLIDGDSASAAEIFAGAIRDHHRGTIIGSRSYGKGSVQGIFPLHAGQAGMRLTTAKFYSPEGRPYSHVGVEPDILVRQTARPINGSVAQGAEDAVLSAALEFARKSFARQPSPADVSTQR